MLDAIHRVLSKSETMAEQALALGESFIPETAVRFLFIGWHQLKLYIARMVRSSRAVNSLLSAKWWILTNLSTDCVNRYLLARYGFHPSQLIHKKSPVRIGDILILPAGSYSSVSPFKGETQRKWAASWHGFFGASLTSENKADPAKRSMARGGSGRAGV